MRILLANKFYYRRGGDCIYTMELEQILKEHGNDVAIFAMDYPDNIDSPWKKYWPKYMSKLDAFTRPFGSSEVKKKFTALLDDFKPDVVHLNNIHTQLSPVIAEIAHKKGIRVVWTLHDTKLVCPCYTCMRDGKPCYDCFTDKTAVIKHKCMPGNIPGSIIGYLEAKKWNKQRLENCVDLFLPPSQYMMDTVVKGGYNQDKFKVLCNFIDINKVQNPKFEKSDYYVYLGRVNQVKGVKTLCKAASQLPYKLIIIGEGELLEELKDTYQENSNIDFLGKMDWNDFRPILEGAKFMVLPAEWSENNPLTVIESQSLGTPVLGANIGGIPELIEQGISGEIFESGNINDLIKHINSMMQTTFDYSSISKNAQNRYNSETYYQNIIDYYKDNRDFNK